MVTMLPTGELEFKVFAPAADSIEVLGSFTGWTARPIVLARDDQGWWRGVARLAPGDYDFQYRVDHERWMADFAAHGVKLNHFGQWVSRLAVHKAA